MGHIISIYCVKGGIAKTTTCITLANILSILGRKVLVVDDDPQSNSTMMLNQYEKNELDIHDLYLDDKLDLNRVRGYIVNTGYTGISLIPSGPNHRDTITALIRNEYQARQLTLRKALSLVRDDYDFILIDNNFNTGALTTNSLSAADYVLAPVGAEGFSYQGLSLLLDEIDNVKKTSNPELELLGVFATKVNARTNIFKNITAMYQREIGDYFIPCYIREDNSVNESNTNFVPLLYYKSRTRAGNDYIELAAELGLITEEECATLMTRHKMP